MGWVIRFFFFGFSSPLSCAHTRVTHAGAEERLFWEGVCNLLLENSPSLTFDLANILPSLPLNPPALSSLSKCVGKQILI